MIVAAILPISAVADDLGPASTTTKEMIKKIVRNIVELQTTITDWIQMRQLTLNTDIHTRRHTLRREWAKMQTHHRQQAANNATCAKFELEKRRKTAHTSESPPTPDPDIPHDTCSICQQHCT